MSPMSDLVAVLMAGGSGTRFWPLSTPDLPKQFLTTLEDVSLYRQAVERAFSFTAAARTLVLGSARFEELITAQSPEIPAGNVVLEPMRRDTAPAITLAAAIAEHRWPGCVMVVMPSDHRITELDEFSATIARASRQAREGGLVTLGIRPTHPATCYGYLRLGERSGPEESVYRVGAFVEKPDEERAREFLKTGEFLWNSGIFVWRATAILDAVRTSLPDTHARITPLATSFGTPSFPDDARAAFELTTPTSIDYGVMEKARDVRVVPASFDWSDVGGWKAIRDLIPETEGGNRVRGRAIVEASQDCLVISEGKEHGVVCLGVEGLVVVSTPDGTLVCREDMAEAIRPHVERILGSTRTST